MKVSLLVWHRQLEVTCQSDWHSCYKSCLKPRQNSAVFPQELLVSVSAQEEFVHLFSDLLQPDYEVAKWSLIEERAKRTRGSGSGLRQGPFGTSGSGTILIGAAGAPIGNLAHRWAIVLVTSGAVIVVPTVLGAVPLEQCPCSLIVLVTSGAVTVVPTLPGAVPLEISPSVTQ